MPREDEDQAVYDPFAADLQMRAFDNVGLEAPDTQELCQPAVVRLLIQNYRVALTQLKSSQEHARALQRDNEKLRAEREELRVSQATFRERDHSTWLEIPAAIGAGFAVNMILGDAKAAAGWLLLAVTMVMLFYVRFQHLRQCPLGGTPPSPGKEDTRE